MRALIFDSSDHTSQGVGRLGFNRDEEALLWTGEQPVDGAGIRAIRTPTVPEGTARLRISVHADHSPAMLAVVAAAVAELLGQNR
jgi:7-keto-8-aminopelargonate synthetase-like enzyme